MHQLIASRFLDDYLVVCPGSTAGIKIPLRRFTELERSATTGEPAPPWLIKAARQRWALDLAPVRPACDFLLVRQKADPQYSRASWEINLGCNYDCEHCYLGLKTFEGLPMADKARLLHVCTTTAPRDRTSRPCGMKRRSSGPTTAPRRPGSSGSRLLRQPR